MSIAVNSIKNMSQIKNIHANAIIHPTAIIEEGAIIEEKVIIGPYCCIGGQVNLKAEVELVSHVSISGNTIIGERTKIYPFASIGHPPQALKYKGEASKTIIGQDNIIREYVTIQPGTENFRMLTEVGNNCYIMASAHIAHDCTVGNNVVMSNSAALGGHVDIGNHVIIGGLAAIHQFVRVGDHALIGGMAGVEKNVIPYALVKGDRAYLSGLNLIGLKRKGFSTEIIDQLMKAYQKIFTDTSLLPLADRVESVKEEYIDNETVKQIIAFITQDSKYPLCMPRA